MRHSMGATEMFNYCHHTLLTGHFTLFGIAVEPIQLTQLFGQSKHRRDEAVVVWGQTCHARVASAKKLCLALVSVTVAARFCSRPIRRTRHSASSWGSNGAFAGLHSIAEVRAFSLL